jgi:hypothetical protein
MFMLLTLATPVNDPPVDRSLTSWSPTIVIGVAAVFAFLMATTVLSGASESLAVIAATAFRALIAELRGLIMILLTLLFVLALVLFGRGHTARPDNLPPPTDTSTSTPPRTVG